MSKEWFILSFKSIIGILSYYIIVFLLGITLSIVILFENNPFFSHLSIMNQTIFGSIGITFVGSSIFYIRKLYKSCIKCEISFPIDKNDKLRQIGVMSYFLFRPLFSLCFTILVILGLKSGIFIIASKNIELEVGFMYLSMFFSFFVGFSSGFFLNILESAGIEILSKLFSNIKKE